MYTIAVCSLFIDMLYRPTYKLVNDIALDVSPVVPVDEHLPLVVQEVDGTARHDHWPVYSALDYLSYFWN